MNNNSQKSILVVDDNPYILKILSMMLELANFKVIKAQDGKEAIERIMNGSEGEFDLIITDYQMPIINGQELAETIKKSDEHSDIPIVLVTQATDIKYENDKKYMVFDKIFYKPVTNEFIKEIKSLVL
ncbi:response regulator [Rickettsiales endosymbiont of Trichoplax sp. H2]|uniref:response regulator n=1 Tax=Rickettsiales endosymbiont of Trichoplax sp. H2 TaxID=2021221 RepID=UPI0012B329F0|nr:response regulator [Rickettsiales endosymbiont of Trichoplax sp. H2]MSO14667.1 Chemotaxis protein CheV [Rickettsiales endosymbiont of Trichoplax sp. H2]